MDISNIQESLTAKNSELNGSTFADVSLCGCNIAGLRGDGYLVSDLIAAHGKSV